MTWDAWKSAVLTKLKETRKSLAREDLQGRVDRLITQLDSLQAPAVVASYQTMQQEECKWDDALLAAWRDGVRATMRVWIDRFFVQGDGVEFIWRARFKRDLLNEFAAHEPWVARVDRIELRALLVDSLEACGYTCLLAEQSSRKTRVRFPDGTERRVTGVVTGIQRKN
jgi:hypothetical protein